MNKSTFASNGSCFGAGSPGGFFVAGQTLKYCNVKYALSSLWEANLTPTGSHVKAHGQRPENG